MNREEDIVFDVVSLFAQTFGSRICFVHPQSTSDEQDTEFISKSVKQAVDRVCVAAKRQIATDVFVRILRSNTAEGIRQTALERGMELTIVGRGREGGSFSRGLSQLYAIIRESPCPVLSV
jgi:nucleotide-binding universal stress UspA family protein